MKKIISIGLFSLLCTFGLSAQLKVAENGNVGIGVAGTPLSKLSIGKEGNSIFNAYIEGDYFGLMVNNRGKMPSSTGYWGTAIQGTTAISSYRGDIGVTGQVGNTTPLYTGRAIGVLGHAKNATSGYNYGTIGAITGSNYGTGILGQDDGNFLGFYIPGRYAGYFKGNVLVTGTINGIVVGNSDIRYKQNIVELGQRKSSSFTKSKANLRTLDNLMSLTPVEYNLKQVYFEPESDTTVVRRGFFNEKSQEFQKKHYGLIAQDVQKLYPELVYEQDNGYLAINYIGLIPLLIQSVKELNEEIESLRNTEDFVIKKSFRAGAESLNENEKAAALFQNTPNPFTQSTQIKYYLPETINTAYLCFYDFQGKQLKQIPISERGDGMLIISGSQFSPGIYLYALIADGSEVDVKRMILTE